MPKEGPKLGQDQRKPKFEYWKMPELKPGVLPDLSGFAFGEGSDFEKIEQLFLESMKEAIRDPQWLLIPTATTRGPLTDIYKERMSRGLPSAQHSRQDEVENLKKLSSCSEEELRDLVKKINDLDSPVNVSSVDIMMRTYEVMAQKYPQLRFFRGADFSAKRGFSGIDFSPGSLATALGYVSTTGYEKPMPVLVSAKFTDVIKAYARGKLMASTEGELYRDSVVLSSSMENVASLQIFRINRDNTEKVLKDFEARAIKL